LGKATFCSSLKLRELLPLVSAVLADYF